LSWTAITWWVSALQPAVAQDETQTRFQRTVQRLQTASPELRGDFAATALTNLTEAYLAEAQLARAHAGRSGHSAKLRGWSAMVDYYARQLPLLLADIELGFPVQLSMDGQQELAITIADRTVIVSPPRLNQQSAFEQAILSDFCATHSCEASLPGNATPEPAPVAMGAVRPEWRFSTQGPVCAYEGIQVRFANNKNLANSRLICAQFLREAISLADELAWQQRNGVVIEWSKVKIQAVSHRTEHVIPVNGAGDSVLVTVPLLYRNPELLQNILPWMRGRLGDQPPASVELNADLYGWQKP